jgi:hypothetical protein
MTKTCEDCGKEAKYTGSYIPDLTAERFNEMIVTVVYNFECECGYHGELWLNGDKVVGPTH